MLDLTAWGFDTVDIEPANVGGLLIEMGEAATVKPDLLARGFRFLAGMPPADEQVIMTKPPTVIIWVKGVEEPLRFEFRNAITIARNRMQAHAFADFIRERCRRNTGVEAAFGRDTMRAA